MHVVVVGAGAAGLGTALALARDGHEVTILERDSTPLPHDPHEAFEWHRAGAPQVRHSHAFLARLRNLLRDRWPDVLARLLQAGATEIVFCENPPVDMVEFEAAAGDDDLVALACRRTTFEWVLREVVAAEPHTRLRDGVTVDGLVAVAGSDRPPLVTGVRITGQNGAEEIEADVVVASVGRRSAVPRWLDDIGVTVDETAEDTGIVYFSRFYRLAGGAEKPPLEGPIGGDLGYLKYAIFQGDNDTWSVTFAVRTDDAALRKRLLDADQFDRAASALPATRGWVRPGVAEAITPVEVMGGLLNRRLRFVDAEGAPLVLGFHAVGDAHTCTNPLYGRGCALGIVAGTLLADAIRDEVDADARCRSYEAATAREILPWYKAAVASDRSARAAAGDPAQTPPTEDGGDPAAAAQAQEFMVDLMREGLMPAARTDQVVFRAFLRSFNLLDPPDAILTNPDVIARVLAAYGDRENRPPAPDLGPPRSDLLEALGDSIT